MEEGKSPIFYKNTYFNMNSTASATSTTINFFTVFVFVSFFHMRSVYHDSQ